MTRRGATHQLRPLADVVAPGDVIAALGSPWSRTNYAEMLHAAKVQHGIKVLLLIHDMLPVYRPEWCDRSLVKTFVRWLETCLPEADVLLANSSYTAGEVERYAVERGVKLAGPVAAIPIGTGFGILPETATAREVAALPTPGSYVLFVSTIELRKNHHLLFRVWRHLLEEMPREHVPTLVFAGRVGWMVNDLMQQLRNTEFLGGKVVLIEDASDPALAQLYRGCLFTLFPSFYEGWGLPVTESLAFGKPCIISIATSLPEAGGMLARYFDPDNLGDALRVIRATIEDRAGLAEWQERVVREFRLVSWGTAAEALIAGLE